MNFSDYEFYIEKNLKCEDLSFEEALELFELPLPILGRIADEIRKKKCGDLVTFVIDRNINYTNVCVSRCKFCAFYARSEEDGYVLSKEEILKKVGEAVKFGATQILMQGGLNPNLGIEWFEDVFRTIKEKFPNVHLHSLSAPEIYFLAKKEGMSIKEVIERLKSAGLDSIPGGGAEILVDRVRKKISPNKVDSKGWLKVMETAHKMGMKTTATMMFGHIETDEDIIEHLFKIRDLQSKTKGFTAFIPWTFQPNRTELYGVVKEPVPPTRYLQVLAISRIVLHNIRNIQTSWLTQGFDVATLGLIFGANDFGGIMLEENVVRATGKPFKPAKVEKICKAVRSIGRPVAIRDTYYNILKYL
jgi:cyclic dehypoxanthinyl futalosine synthase